MDPSAGEGSPRPETGRFELSAAPVALTADYLEAVARVEALPANRSGADKSWVWPALEHATAHFARAVRVR